MFSKYCIGLRILSFFRLGFAIFLRSTIKYSVHFWQSKQAIQDCQKLCVWDCYKSSKKCIQPAYSWPQDANKRPYFFVQTKMNGIAWTNQVASQIYRIEKHFNLPSEDLLFIDYFHCNWKTFYVLFLLIAWFH